MSDIDPTAIMAEHAPAPFYCFVCCDLDGCAVEGPCLPYRLAEALTVERARSAKFTHILDQYEGGTISKVACVSLMLNVTQESNIAHPEGASVAHQIPRGAERSQQIATDPDRSQLDGPSETRSD